MTPSPSRYPPSLLLLLLSLSVSATYMHAAVCVGAVPVLALVKLARAQRCMVF